jgi:uncharacterized protein
MTVLVLAKKPVPGRVKTRLCPPCTPEEASAIAAASLADTLDAVGRSAATERVLVTDQPVAVPPGWTPSLQRGGPLSERIANAFLDTGRPRTVLVGMDTPQLVPATIDLALRLLTEPGGPDATLGRADDGGWWLLGLRDPRPAEALRTVPTSTSRTGQLTYATLRALGLRVTGLPRLRDVDTAADAVAVAALCPPDSAFARAVAAHVPSAVAR